MNVCDYEAGDAGLVPVVQVMNSCLDHWRASGVWERIAKWKAPVVEPRESSMFNSVIQDFASRLEMPGSTGAVFFAVCRGKVRGQKKSARVLGLNRSPAGLGAAPDGLSVRQLSSCQECLMSVNREHGA